MRTTRFGLAVAGVVVFAATPATAYTVYVSNEKGNSLTVIDSATLEVQATIPVGQRPRGIMMTKDGKQVLICASDDDTVQILDVASREIVGDLPSGPDPEQLNIHPSGSPVYVANEDDALMTAIDLKDKAVVAQVLTLLQGVRSVRRLQAKEEQMHAMKIYDHVIARGGKVSFQDIEAPKNKWASAAKVFEHAYAHEQKVTGMINGLVDLASSEKDHATFEMLQWFVKEQVEEEEQASYILNQIIIAGDSPGHLFYLDHHLGKRE